MDTEKIKQLEQIVTTISENRDDERIDNDPRIGKIREITGAGLDALDSEEIHYYCYYGTLNYSLEETVYALMHNGKHPKKEVREFHLWKMCGETNFTDEDIYVAYKYRHKFDSAKSIVDKLAIFPLEELFSYIEKQFPDWVKKDTTWHGSNWKDHYTFEPKEQKEYAIEEWIYITLYDKQVVRILFANIDTSVENNMAEYLKSLGYTVYYYEKDKIYSRDYSFPS